MKGTWGGPTRSFGCCNNCPEKKLHAIPKSLPVHSDESNLPIRNMAADETPSSATAGPAPVAANSESKDSGPADAQNNGNRNNNGHGKRGGGKGRERGNDKPWEKKRKHTGFGSAK